MAVNAATVIYVLCIAFEITLIVGYVTHRQHDGLTAQDDKTPHVIDSVLSDQTSVRHFAIHSLCRHYKGQKYFYNVLKSKLCQMRGTFVVHLVMTMCEERNTNLFYWVSELFDIDGDGHISYFEKHYYEYND